MDYLYLTQIPKQKQYRMTQPIEMDFESWFDIYVDHARGQLKYQGPIDKGSASMDYENGKSPEEAAKAFVEEMNS